MTAARGAGLNRAVILALLCIVSCTGIAAADLSQSVYPVTGKVYVSNVTFDPAIFFTGDSGTVTVEITNGNNNVSVMTNHATFMDNKIKLVSGTYDYSNTLGPLQVRPYTFSITTDASPGDYYPVFSLTFYDSTLYHPMNLRVDNTPVTVSVLDAPDTFTQGRKKTVMVQVSNPRKNDVTNVALVASADGATINPADTYIGTIAAGQTVIQNISVTPDRETTLDIVANYNNGYNPHNASTTLPIVFGVDKKSANPVISNIATKTAGDVFHVTGDVTNAGLETANAVTVTSLSPAMPEDPYQSYVIGALKPDDFGSFEVTFRTKGAQSVPLQVSYKDSDGNIVTSQYTVSLAGNATADAMNRQGNPLLIPILAIVIIALAAGGWYFYNKRQKKL